MQLTQNDIKIEEQHLQDTLELINNRISSLKTLINDSKKDIRKSNKEMWQETSSTLDNLDVIIEFNQYLSELKSLERKYFFYKDRLVILQKLQINPYFARIDFKPDDIVSMEKIYIGISTFINDKSEDIIIYDWRAPISGMFYDFSPGRAEYTSPDGKILGELLLKRQFRIENSKMELVFNTDIKIDDEILQEILSGNSDDKMRDIVTSIQKEQNIIIRDETNKVLIVQGPAGSGKTSIALHRAAYLMYKHRKSLSAENILIFSPNDIFTSYISDVLPSLGEKNPNTFSFYDFSKEFLLDTYKVESPYEHIEYMFSDFSKKKIYAKNKSAELKSTMGFKNILDDYIDMINNTSLIFKDITHNGYIAAKKEDIEDMYSKTYKNLLYGDKRNHIRERLFSLTESLKKDTVRKKVDEMRANDELGINPDISLRRSALKNMSETIHFMKEQIENVTKYDIYKLYINLFEERDLFIKHTINLKINGNIDDIIDYTKRNLYNKIIPYEDLASFLYFKSRLEKTTSKYNIRHIIVDEGQDFSILNYAFLNSIFERSKTTIISDLNQSIHPFLHLNNYENLNSVYDKNETKLLILKRSYRSTKEIVELTNHILENSNSISNVARSGDKPVIKTFSDFSKMDNEVLKVLQAFKEGTIKSAAIICKSSSESRNLYERLKNKVKMTLIKTENENFESGFIIIPSYLAKGLEFDGVITYDASDKKYNSESDRRLLYTICTRAKHKLFLFGHQNISKLIELKY